MRRDRDDGLDELRAALRADAAGVAIALLGQPNQTLSTKRTLRWGGKGSLAVEITGPKRGMWFSHEATEGKDLLGLIREQHGCSFPDAVAWARSHTGLAEPEDEDSEARQRREVHAAERRAQRAEQDAIDQAKAEAEQASSVAWVQRVVGETAPIEGTPADWYLRQERGIARPVGGWPAAVRWHPRLHALVMVATLADGTVQRLQRVHLGPNGAKMDPAEMEQRRYQAVKMTNGPQVGGAVVRLPGDAVGPLLVAEGPETALAAWASTGHETWITLGAMGKAILPAGRPIVVCAEDDAPAHDPKHGSAAKALNKAMRDWRAAKLNILVCRPWSKRRRDKSDLADVILADGADAVRMRIAAALGTNTDPVPDRVDVAEGRDTVAKVSRAFFAPVVAHSIHLADTIAANAAAKAEMKARVKAREAARGTKAEQAPLPALASYTHAIKVDVGSGKSYAARDEASKVLAGMRGRGDKRTLVLAVPRHTLGEEQAALFEALPTSQAAGLKAAIWRGRAAPNPRHEDYIDPNVPQHAKASMCGDLDRVADAQDAGVDVQTAVCKSKVSTGDGKPRTMKCPLFDVCAYQAQRGVEADLWIVPHESLFHKKPEAIGEVAAVIVDEAAYRKGGIGTEGRHLALPLDALRSDPTVRYKSGMLDRAGSHRLGYLHGLLLNACDQQQDGPLGKAFLLGQMLTADSAFEAYEWEQKRRVRFLHPGQGKEARKEAVQASSENATIKRAAMIWDAARVQLGKHGPDRSGWLELATEEGKHGPARLLRIKGLSEIKEGWKAPTLLLDALLPLDLVRFFWPDAQLVADVRVHMPHQHIYQVIDRAYAKSMLEQLGEESDAADKEKNRRKNRLGDLRDVVVREARRFAPGQVLMVLQKSVKESLLALGPLPGNIDLAHHNGVAGVDRWRDVACLIVVGRTQPPVGAVERMAEALTGTAMAAPAEWYDRADAVREMADGTTLPAEADRHPDPVAESLRWQIAEGELIQIIGRGRGVNRTEANPLTVLVLTDLPIPMPLAGTLTAKELEPSPVDQMMAAGGVVLENARHVAAAYPSLWKTHNAADLAMRRSPSFSYKYLPIGKRRTPRLAYQVKGPGQKPAAGFYDADLCPDPQAFIQAALGDLAWFKIEGQNDAPKPPEPPKPSRRPKVDQVEPAPDAAPHGGEPDADDLDSDDMPEPPDGHPAFEEPPLDPGWDRAGTEADDLRFAEWEALAEDGAGSTCPVEVDGSPNGSNSDGGILVTAMPFGCGDRLSETTPRARGLNTKEINQVVSDDFALDDALRTPARAVSMASDLACDVPWLHPDVRAVAGPDGSTVLTCPFCCEQHQHHGYGHRFAHCEDPQGRGYVLRETGPAPAGSSGVAGARAGPW